MSSKQFLLTIDVHHLLCIISNAKQIFTARQMNRRCSMTTIADHTACSIMQYGWL